MSKYLIVSGDPSGDIHSANLMREIRHLDARAEFIGIGGEKMISEGLQSIAKMSDVAVVGFWEVAKKYTYFKNLLEECTSILKNYKIDVFIPVDYPGFNIRLARKAKDLSIPVIYYIAPQLWAWGKNRAKQLAKVTDKLLVVFPFEVKYFNGFGIDAHFVGHPLLDNEILSGNFKPFNERNGKVAFFPGSRMQEVKKHLRLFSEILDLNNSGGFNLNFTIAKSSNIPLEIFSEFSKFSNVEIAENSYEIIQNSSAGIIKTGTSNLEAALCGLPIAMFYKTSFLTYQIAQRLINLPYISLINILSNKPVVKEFIQNDATPNNILSHIKMILTDENYFNAIQADFKNIKQILGEKGASAQAAKIIIESL
ncbi:MAG: lipid-A-disaccharide synthase [Candidatus Kapabacteria bacterium]|nr:lipid-A-disaccharide synthase [Ignavibacteriota bacterium]MCW5885088.1 lipid-A-disaccharide synthase [Candidatus Kapabacteria bacterium]